MNEHINYEDDFIKSYFTAFNQLYGVCEEDLRKYYNESIYDGYPLESSGSIWTSEGKAIYCIIRIIKPVKILEIGNFKGKSTNHILQAIEMNGFGEIHLVDIVEQIDYDTIHNTQFERYIEDSLRFLNKPLNYDLYIHDGCHEYKHVKKELELIVENTTVDFNIWSHDYFKILPPQCEVMKAWKTVEDKFNNKYPVKDSISDCGFIIADYKI